MNRSNIVGYLLPVVCAGIAIVTTSDAGTLCRNVHAPCPHEGPGTASSTAPDTLTGKGMVDAGHDTVRTRTPVTSAERGKVSATSIADSGSIAYGAPRSSTQAQGPSADDDRSREQLRRAKIEAHRATKPDMDALGQVLDLYMQRSGALATFTEQAAQAMTDFGQKIAVKGKESNMTIVQRPEASNGNALIIMPVDPLVYGPVRVVNVDGAVIWQGDVTASTTIDMSKQPSGMYFVQGVGRSLPLGIRN